MDPPTFGMAPETWYVMPRFQPLVAANDGNLEIQVLCVVWFIVFWVVLAIPLLMGFGPAGVLAGRLFFVFSIA